MTTLAGKVAVVSGSGRSIGKAIAMKLARSGTAVVVNDVDAEPADRRTKEILKTGGKAVSCVGDVSAPDFAARFVNTALEGFGWLDIIVNNTGYAWDSVVQKTTGEQWQAMLDVHVTAPFRILRAASDYLRASSKREKEEGNVVHRKVVNISSISRFTAIPGRPDIRPARRQ